MIKELTRYRNQNKFIFFSDEQTFFNLQNVET